MSSAESTNPAMQLPACRFVPHMHEGRVNISNPRGKVKDVDKAGSLDYTHVGNEGGAHAEP